MKRRAIPIVAALATMNGAALLVAACDDGTSAVEDAGTSEGGAGDGASAEGSADGAPDKPDVQTSKEGGNCSPVKGECDIVLQDCADEDGQKRECVVGPSGSQLVAQCVPVQASQQLPMGRSCCPGANNPCLPGLTCVGDPCVDGGPVLGRCSPACCEDDHASCGQSDPEGIGGQCDLTLFSNNTELHHVCSYRERCKPFGVEPCKVGQLCLVEDKAGTAGCIVSNNVPLRQPCQFANDCADGLICVGGGDAGRCRMTCLTPNSNPPFDAAAADGAPGRGGCPVNETCTGPSFSNLPDWLQLCEYSDGG